MFEFQHVAGNFQSEFHVKHDRQERESDLDFGKTAAQAAMRAPAEGSGRSGLFALRPLRREAFDIEALRFGKTLRQMVGDRLSDRCSHDIAIARSQGLCAGIVRPK